MRKNRPTFDVFVSHDLRDNRVAGDVVRALRSYGLKVFTRDEVPVADRIEDAVWEAMAESQAFIAVISNEGPTSSIAFEVGAANAWNKPIYGIVSDPATIHSFPSLHRIRLYPASRIDEIAQEILRASDSLSDQEIEVLLEEYHRAGVPVDQLALQPRQLQELTKLFQKRAKRSISAEQLLHLLLRLRKTRELPAVASR